MKKFFLLMSVFFMALSFTACSDDDEPADNGGGSEKPGKPEQLTPSQVAATWECTNVAWEGKGSKNFNSGERFLILNTDGTGIDGTLDLEYEIKDRNLIFKYKKGNQEIFGVTNVTDTDLVLKNMSSNTIISFKKAKFEGFADRIINNWSATSVKWVDETSREYKNGELMLSFNKDGSGLDGRHEFKYVIDKNNLTLNYTKGDVSKFIILSLTDKGLTIRSTEKGTLISYKLTDFAKFSEDLATTWDMTEQSWGNSATSSPMPGEKLLTFNNDKTGIDGIQNFTYTLNGNKLTFKYDGGKISNFIILKLTSDNMLIKLPEIDYTASFKKANFDDFTTRIVKTWNVEQIVWKDGNATDYPAGTQQLKFNADGTGKDKSFDITYSLDKKNLVLQYSNGNKQQFEILALSDYDLTIREINKGYIAYCKAIIL